MSLTQAQPNPRVAAAISGQRSAIREQIARVLDERFEELQARLAREFEEEIGERVDSAVEAASGSIRSGARREAAEAFNQILRRLHACETDEEWRVALVDASAGFCSHAMLFEAGHESLRLLRASGAAAPAGFEAPLRGAPAFGAAIESGGVVITLVSAAELSSPVAAMLEAVKAVKCAIVPVTADGKTETVVVAAGEELDINGLEAVAALAGAALDRRARKPTRTLSDESGAPLTNEEEALRLRAARFARVRAAEIRLYKASAVRDGRERGKLYLELKEEIDSARAAYARQFLHASPAMPDFLHRELLRSLANDEVSALGEEYPGPLV
ncbi:MAG TPA: hypothetical protein VF767_05485 [Bryobacteraceae bacterium]